MDQPETNSWLTSTMPSGALETTTILLRFGVSIALGVCVAAVYRFTRSGHDYHRSFLVTLLGTAVVMTVIQWNIALSLGMFGAVSVIRFRTAVQDPRDLTFLFLSIAVGLACSITDFRIAVLGTLVVSGVLVAAELLFRERGAGASGFRLSLRLGVSAQPDLVEGAVNHVVSRARLLETSQNKKGWDYVFWIPSEGLELPRILAGLREHLEGIERVKLETGHRVPVGRVARELDLR